MAKPSSLPEWNTDGSNRIEPAPAKKASGWAVNDVPPSGYFNWWKNLVFQWLSWLNDTITSNGHVLHGPHRRTVSVIQGWHQGNRWTFGTLPSPDDALGWIGAASGSNGAVYFPIELPVGERILAVRARVKNTSFLYNITLKLFKANAFGASKTRTQLGTTQSTSGDGATTLTVDLSGAPATVLAGYEYWAEIDGGNGGIDHLIYGVEVEFDRVP